MRHEVSLKPSADSQSLGGYDAPTLEAYGSPAPAYDAPVYGYKMERPSLTVSVRPSATSLSSGTTQASKNSESWYIAPHLQPHWNFVHASAARKAVDEERRAAREASEARIHKSLARADARARLEGVPRNLQPHPHTWAGIPGTAKTADSDVNPMHVVVLDGRHKVPTDKQRGCGAGVWAWFASWIARPTTDADTAHHSVV
jgi:hypothetical protein